MVRTDTVAIFLIINEFRIGFKFIECSIQVDKQNHVEKFGPGPTAVTLGPEIGKQGIFAILVFRFSQIFRFFETKSGNFIAVQIEKLTFEAKTRNFSVFYKGVSNDPI